MVNPNIELEEIAVEPMTLKEALAMCDTGWDGDIPESQKSNRLEEWFSPGIYPIPLRCVLVREVVLKPIVASQVHFLPSPT